MPCPEVCSLGGLDNEPLVVGLGGQVAFSMMGFLSQEACDPKTLASCQRVWACCWGWSQGRRGAGATSLPSTVPCPVSGWRRWRDGQGGAVVLLEGVGEHWSAGSYGHHRQMVSTAGRREELTTPGQGQA